MKLLRTGLILFMSATAVYSQTRDLRITAQPKPALPENYGTHDVQGTVVLKIEFLATGQIGKIFVLLKLTPQLTDLAVEAAKKIQFEPKIVDGKAVDAFKTVEYAYSWQYSGWRVTSAASSSAPTSSPSQMPKIEPGVSKELAEWRSAHYSDVRYKLNLELEKMSPRINGKIMITLSVSGSEPKSVGAASNSVPPIILDWGTIPGHEKESYLSNVSINWKSLERRVMSDYVVSGIDQPIYIESKGHLIFPDGVVAGENVIELTFTSPILFSGSAIARYFDKQDGAEHINSNFAPSIVSTAFPVFDQANLKATISLTLEAPNDWNIVSNTNVVETVGTVKNDDFNPKTGWSGKPVTISHFTETNPISIYEFSFKTGPKK